MMKGNSIVVAVVLGIAFVCGLAWAGTKVMKGRRPANEITVTGAAEMQISSDLIVWKASYSATAKDLKTAYIQITEYKKQVEEYLRSKNIPSDAIQFESVDINKQYDYQSNGNGGGRSVFSGYQLSQPVQVTSNDIDRVEALSRDITELIDKGMEITSYPPSYYYTKLNESKHEMLKAASEDALKRATAIAEGSNRKVGKLQRTQMGVFQVVGLYSDEDYSWGGSFNTSSREKTISVTVKSSYSVH